MLIFTIRDRTHRLIDGLIKRLDQKNKSPQDREAITALEQALLDELKTMRDEPDILKEEEGMVFYTDDTIDYCGHYRIVDEYTGEIAFNEDDPVYQSLKTVLLNMGEDIHKVKTIDELKEIEMTPRYFYQFDLFLTRKYHQMKPKTLEEAMVRAVIIGDRETADHLREKWGRQKAMGLHVIDTHHDLPEGEKT